MTAFLRWRRWNKEEKRKGWRLYGWFTALSCAGSVAGALAYAARIGFLYGLYVTRNVPKQQTNAARAASLQLSRGSWGSVAAFVAISPFEFGFVTVAQLLVLQRMHRFSTRKSQRQRHWHLSGRIFLGSVIACHAICVFGNIAASAQYAQAAELFSSATTAILANDTASANSYELQARDKTVQAVKAAAVQRFTEVFVLLMIDAAFVFVGVHSHRVIATALRALFVAEREVISISRAAGSALDASASVKLFGEVSYQGRWLQRKVLGTFVFVFVSFLLRSVFTVLFAMASAFTEENNPCAASACDVCKNFYSHLLFWMIYTPVFQQTIVLISSPLTLIIALWGMSGVRSIEQMEDIDVKSGVHPLPPTYKTFVSIILICSTGSAQVSF